MDPNQAMIAAAQAAAEAALREAEAKDADRHKQQRLQQQQQQQRLQQHQRQQDEQQQAIINNNDVPMNDLALQRHQQQQQQMPSGVQQQELMGDLYMQQQQQQQQQPSSHQEQLMLDLLYQQEQQQQQQQGGNMAVETNQLMDQQQEQQQQSPSQSSLPREHYMTITSDGTIVEASNTVIGFPPEALLMTSTYDTLFDEDLPGFLCVKSQFWDHAQQLEVLQVPVRRRSIDGEWIWLAVSAVQWMEHSPVGGGVLVLCERLIDAQDLPTAQFLNRSIRITAIVVQAVEAARLSTNNNSNNNTASGEGTNNNGSQDGNKNNQSTLRRDESGTLLNETAEMEQLLRRFQENGSLDISNNNNENWHELLEIATTQGKGGSGAGGGGDNNNNNNNNNGAKDADNDPNNKKKGFDPNSMIESVRQGIRLDLGLTTFLQPQEVRLLAVVLTGELPVHEVAPLVLQSLQSVTASGFQPPLQPLDGALSPLGDLLDLWQQQQLQQRQQQQQQQQQQEQMRARRGGHPFSSSTQSSQQPFARGFQQPQQPQHGLAGSPQQQQAMAGSPMSIVGAASPPSLPPPPPPPPISVVNLSYTYIGNAGIDILGPVLFTSGTVLQTIDLSFCGIEEKGFLSLAKALQKRKKKTDLDPIKGLILSGNYISSNSASALGAALAISTDQGGSSRSSKQKERVRQRRGRSRSAGGYDSDSSDDDEDDFFEDDFSGGQNHRGRRNSKRDSKQQQPQGEKKEASPSCHKNSGIQVLHLASTSLKAAALGRLLEGMGPHSSLRELNLSSNHFGAAGATVLSQCLQNSGNNKLPTPTNHAGLGGGGKKKPGKQNVPLPYLDRIDISNNSLGDEGATQLTKIVSSRSQVHLIDLRLSSNSITSTGIETIMNKLLHHNLISLALDKNAIGDQGCQLVAASLQSMKSLGRLNLNFNQIGSRGINSLMRSLIACESVTFLGLSGNILKISGAMSLAFTLAQHPRLEELHLDNCCLGQAAQCHITAGIISNRWVPMKRLAGYAVGPPMVAIGALKPYAQNLSNEECFRIRKDEQMKTILQWMESHRGANKQHNAAMGGGGAGLNNHMDPSVVSALGSDSSDQRFLTPEFVSNINDVHGIPAQNAYFRMLGWLASIPFDDDELTVLQKYFYDVDGGDGDRGSDGYINLKLRGDLLAALDSEMAEEIRDVFPALGEALKGSVGIDLDKIFGSFLSRNGTNHHPQQQVTTKWQKELTGASVTDQGLSSDMSAKPPSVEKNNSCAAATRSSMETIPENEYVEQPHSDNPMSEEDQQQPQGDQQMATTKDKKVTRARPRITLFPKFEQQLEQLKSAAAEMIEQEDDPMHHEVILTQYAEASLTILRQLRYHCMNSGLDGWRQGGLKRKVLVVDDSRITRRLVSRAFEDANFIVDTASNGAEGVEKLKASIYDIAFMDIDMPVMNGFEATKKLREWEDASRPGARQPICALTAAYVDDFERSELMKFKEAGLDVMESKPCNIPRLLKVVDDVSPMFSNLRLDVTQQERSSSASSGAGTMMSNGNMSSSTN